MSKLSKEQISEIISLYTNGETPKNIGLKFGVYNNSITRILKRYGIERNQQIKTSQPIIDQIIIDYTTGISSETIAAKYNLDGATVCRILKRNNITIRSSIKNKRQFINTEEKSYFLKPIYADGNYGTTYIHKYNDNLLNSKTVSSLSDDDKEEVSQFLFKFYRENGFPYPKVDNDILLTTFNKVCSFDINNIENNGVLSIYDYVGHEIVKHFASPHYYKVKNHESSLSMVEAFNNDSLLMKTIKNRLDGKFNMTGNMLKQGLANSRAAFKASFFNIALGKYLYTKYGKENDIIYDYSMGFGQRLTAALSLPYKATYIGVDPWKEAFEGNKNLLDFFKTNLSTLKVDAELFNVGSENFCPEEYHDKVSLAFSSPPYYSTERYSTDSSQAYNSGYPAFLQWWRKTVQNIDLLLKSDGYFIVNIAEKLGSFNLCEDMKSICLEQGFILHETLFIQLTKNLKFNSKKRSGHKLEPVLVFKKIS